MRNRPGFLIGRLYLTVLLGIINGGVMQARDSALIVDHNFVAIDHIPPAAFMQAQAKLKVAYGHTSHGSQAVAGMNALRKKDPALFAFGPQGSEKSLSFRDTTPRGDLGNPDRTTWATRTREFLKGEGSDRNVIVWSWCGQVSNARESDINTYLTLMSELEKEFPAVTFVYMTGHLDGSGEKGNLNLRNEQIRRFCREKNKVLFDFADIESFDPDGKTNFMLLNANDACDYFRDGQKRNWADEWLQRNPEHSFLLPASAAHSRPLNGAMKGQAFWHMLVRIAGWVPAK